jgi:hypothetical protein
LDADEMHCEIFGQFGVLASQSLRLFWYPIKRTLTKMEYRNTGLGTRQHQQNLPIRSQPVLCTVLVATSGQTIQLIKKRPLSTTSL